MPGLGAGVVRIKGTGRALAMSVDGNGRYCYLDPYRGAMLAVAEASRNVACAGARPLGATNCLNFGNPERPAIMWQFAKAVEGIGAARRAPPALDLDAERALQSLLVALADERLIRSAHDCSDGGIAVAVAECCFETNGMGAELSLDAVQAARDARINTAAALFGES